LNDSIRREFDHKINRLTKSKVYLDFCEEVYGYRMYLFNMMDKEQLDFIFKSIPLSPDDTVLDLGCGSGSILNALVKKSGCSGVGIDQLESNIVEIENKNILYINSDIDTISDFHLKPTVTLFIDSIYFSSAPEMLLKYLCDKKNNKIYLFYSQYLFNGNMADKSTLRKGFTKVAAILKGIQVPYEIIEYSENERLLYEKSIHSLKKREDDFICEGNHDLYEEKLKEQIMGKQLYDEGNASRYLYIIG